MSDVVPLNPRQRQLVENCVGLARAIGHRAWQRLVGYERDEIIAYATQGLVAAALRWEDYCRERSFEAYGVDSASWFQTYASRRINGAIVDALRAADPATRRERALIKQIISSGVDLSSPWEHESPQVIAARAGMPVADVERAIAALIRMPVPLEETTEDMWPADACNVADDALQARLRGRVVKVLRGLSETHQLVVAMAYYLDLPDEEIAKRLPELKHDVEWVAALREQAASEIRDVLRHELTLEAPEEALAG